METSIKALQAEAQANFLRYRPGQRRGHYESYFIRANKDHDSKAFWIRYTLFSPNNEPEKAIGELWAVYFDAKRHKPHAVKAEFPLGQCVLNQTHFNIQIGESSLDTVHAKGNALDMSWDLKYRSEAKPLFFLPLNFYQLPFPKAKSLVPQPFSVFNGELQCGDEIIKIDNWSGSQNHNWGEKHTDYYAWGQVAGFDNAPDTFLELITAQLKIGPVKTPMMTVLVLRHRGKEYKLNNLKHWFSSKAKFKYFDWSFECENKEVKIKGRIFAPAEAFVGLRYHNPPGGDKFCLNSKIASCDISITEKEKLGIKESLHTDYRCAFEILTDDKTSHGVEILF
jgi:hypothetical protein